MTRRAVFGTPAGPIADPPDEGSLVLRRQLALPGHYVAPRSDTERQLAEIWRRALNMDCVGAEDDYVDLGGDSYLAAVIFALIEEVFGVRLPMATLVGAPTIAAFAREVDRSRERPNAPDGGGSPQPIDEA
jgi:acyl carrier protein